MRLNKATLKPIRQIRILGLQDEVNFNYPGADMKKKDAKQRWTGTSKEKNDVQKANQSEGVRVNFNSHAVLFCRFRIN